MLGERLQYLRLEKGMTQKELSKVFKVSLKTIQFYEQNRTIPDIYLVAEMAKFFNVSCDYILGVVNTPIPLDEIEAEAKDHIYMPKEFMKNKETRRTYGISNSRFENIKTFVKIELRNIIINNIIS